jgi:hypothetical protein
MDTALGGLKFGLSHFVEALFMPGKALRFQEISVLKPGE